MFTLFRAAGASGHVFLLSGGKLRDKGLAYSGLIGPLATVAVVPTIAQSVNFSVEAQTKDKQAATASGSVTLSFKPAMAVSGFDFTVDRKSGGYISRWNEMLRAKVTEHVVRAVVGQVKNFNIEEVILEQATLETAVLAALRSEEFAAAGIVVESCSIPNIEPSDDEVGESIGAAERQTMLATADKALHDRRIAAAANDRAVKKYEAATSLVLEQEQGRLLEEKAKNMQAEAMADAEAMETRLKPMQELSSGTLLGVAIMKLAETGKLGNINLTSEFFAAVSAAKE
jgi:hypothetical protein